MSSQPPSGPPPDGDPQNGPGHPGQPPQGQPPQDQPPQQPWAQPGQPAQGQQPGEPGQQPWAQPGQPQGPGGYNPGPGQPWGQPEPGPSDRNKLPFILAGVAAVVIVIAVVLVLVLQGGGGNSPDEVADDFIAAAKAHDCNKAYALLSDGAKEEVGDCDSNADEVVPAEDIDVTFGKVSISDESDTSATATVDATFEGQTVPLPISMVNEDGTWKIDKIG